MPSSGASRTDGRRPDAGVGVAASDVWAEDASPAGGGGADTGAAAAEMRPRWGIVGSGGGVEGRVGTGTSLGPGRRRRTRAEREERDGLRGRGLVNAPGGEEGEAPAGARDASMGS